MTLRPEPQRSEQKFGCPIDLTGEEGIKMKNKESIALVQNEKDRWLELPVEALLSWSVDLCQISNLVQATHDLDVEGSEDARVLMRLLMDKVLAMIDGILKDIDSVKQGIANHPEDIMDNKA